MGDSPVRAACARWADHERHAEVVRRNLESPGLPARDRERLVDELNGHMLAQAVIAAELAGAV